MDDFDLEQQAIQARRQRAAALRGSQMPDGRMVGNVYVRPSFAQYLATGLKQYAGAKDEQAADAEMKDLSTKRQQEMANALRGFSERMQDKPGQSAPGTEEDPGYTIPGQKADPMAAYGQLLQSPMADLRKMGMQGIIQMPELKARQEEAAANRAFRAEQGEIDRKARAEATAIANQQRMEQMQQAHQLRMDAMAAQNASREQMAQAQREFQQQQAEAARAFQKEMKALGGSMASQQPYFQPVQTAQGVFAFNARTGRVEPVTGPGGVPIVGAAADPALQGRIAGAKTGAQTEAKMATEARIEAPKAIAQAEEAIKLVDALLVAPGFKQAVGGSRLVGIQKIPGTAAKDFDIRLDQLKGKQFLQAFESLKGGGAITEVEGKKATDAIARMDAAGSEAEFTKAAREFQDVIRSGIERAKKAQGGAPAAPSAPKRIKLDAQGNIVP